MFRKPGEEAEPEAGKEEPEAEEEAWELPEADTDAGSDEALRTEEEAEPEELPQPEAVSGLEETPGAGEGLKAEEESGRAEPKVHFHLNGQPISLPKKEDGSAYFLMDMIQYSGVDLKQPKGRISLTVNGTPGVFLQQLREGDNIRIEEEEA